MKQRPRCHIESTMATHQIFGWACGTKNRKHLVGIVGALLVMTSAALVSAAGREKPAVTVEEKAKHISNGLGQKPFDVTRHTIPLKEIHRNVPKDFIPALLRPRFNSAQDVAKLLRDSDRVVGVFLNRDSRAYPIRILNYHELVNDAVGGQPILVSW